VHYFGVITNRDYIKIGGIARPFWEFLDEQPDGWLSSLAYHRKDVPQDRPHIWDCGAWTYRERETPQLGRHLVTPEWALGKYAEYAIPGDFVVAPDHMLIPKLGGFEARRAFNRESAARFLEIAGAGPFRPMATVHGLTLDERLRHAEWLQSLGYGAIALGGLAGQATNRKLCIAVVRALRAALPAVHLHVLGLSSPQFAAEWERSRVDSFDGSSHFKQAFIAKVYFAARGAEMVRYEAVPPGESPTAPTCDCTACVRLRDDGVDTRAYGSNQHNMGRAAHNMNQLMKAQKAAISQQCVDPDEELELAL
jgi:hypothetical protein